MNQIVLNIIIAFLWVLFQDEDHFKFSTFLFWISNWFNCHLYITQVFSDDFYVKNLGSY